MKTTLYQKNLRLQTADREIRQLTIKSPFAELMLHGKFLETRTRPTNYRGLVLIHCAKFGWPWDEVLNIAGEKQFDRILKLFNSDFGQSDNGGKAIGIGTLKNCRPMTRRDEDGAFVRYNSDLYVWEFENVSAIRPFAVQGTQGMNLISDETFGKIIYV